MRRFERAGHLWPVPLPGVTRPCASRGGWPACGGWRAGGGSRPLPGVDADRWRAVARLAETGVAAPATTSVGRLFDAVARSAAYG